MLSKEDHDIVKAAAEILKKELASIVPATVGETGKVGVHKFGVFTVKKSKAREVTNPAVAGGKVSVPERFVVRFSASKTWLEELNA